MQMSTSFTILCMKTCGVNRGILNISLLLVAAVITFTSNRSFAQQSQAQQAQPPQRRQAPAEVKYPAQLTAELVKLRDAAMQSDYAYKQLAHLSHNIGPRLTGSAGAAKAVEYVAD